MSATDFDEFLQDAVMTVHDVWTAAKGRELTPEELQALNSNLENFFSDKRRDSAIVV